MTTDPLLAILAPGHDASHITGMQPGLNAALTRLIADAPGGITINSGYRSVERQQQLWQEALKKYGSEAAARKWVAPPGRSQHNHGGAADLGYASPAVEQWVHQNAAKYGLNFRLGNEPWHVELAGGGPSAGIVGAGNPAPAGAMSDASAPADFGPLPFASNGDLFAAALAQTFAPSAARASTDLAAQPPQGKGLIPNLDPARQDALLEEIQAALSRA